MDKLIAYSMKVDAEIWKKFKLKVIMNDKSIKDVLLEFIAKYSK